MIDLYRLTGFPDPFFKTIQFSSINALSGSLESRSQFNVLRATQDIPYLLASGKGVLVGITATIMNPASVPSSWGNWWGEGDEKIFVDEDKIPSTFGTGSEYYFNYAWSSSEIFTLPFCGQPGNNGPTNRGFVSN